MTEQITDTCNGGLPDGYVHQHSAACYREGYKAGEAEGADVTLVVQRHTPLIAPHPADLGMQSTVWTASCTCGWGHPNYWSEEFGARGAFIRHVCRTHTPEELWGPFEEYL